MWFHKRINSLPTDCLSAFDELVPSKFIWKITLTYIIPRTREEHLNIASGDNNLREKWIFKQRICVIPCEVSLLSSRTMLYLYNRDFIIRAVLLDFRLYCIIWFGLVSVHLLCLLSLTGWFRKFVFDLYFSGV